MRYHQPPPLQLSSTKPTYTAFRDARMRQLESMFSINLENSRYVCILLVTQLLTNANNFFNRCLFVFLFFFQQFQVDPGGQSPPEYTPLTRRVQLSFRRATSSLRVSGLV